MATAMQMEMHTAHGYGNGHGHSYGHARGTLLEWYPPGLPPDHEMLRVQA